VELIGLEPNACDIDVTDLAPRRIGAVVQVRRQQLEPSLDRLDICQVTQSTLVAPSLLRLSRDGSLELTNALTYSAQTGGEVRLPLVRSAYGALLRTVRGEGQV
jgi:hypothetical protein